MTVRWVFEGVSGLVNTSVFCSDACQSSEVTLSGTTNLAELLTPSELFELYPFK